MSGCTSMYIPLRHDKATEPSAETAAAPATTTPAALSPARANLEPVSKVPTSIIDSDGPFRKPAADVQPQRREPLFMPLSRHPRQHRRLAG
jgi:hypothetical protein